MSIEDKMKNVYDVLVGRGGTYAANRQMALLNVVVSIYATMHTYPSQLCVTQDEFSILEDIYHNPDKQTVPPDCIARIAYDSISVIKDNHRHEPIEITIAHGVNDTYADYAIAQYKQIYNLLIDGAGDDYDDEI